MTQGRSRRRQATRDGQRCFPVRALFQSLTVITLEGGQILPSFGELTFLHPCRGGAGVLVHFCLDHRRRDTGGATEAQNSTLTFTNIPVHESTLRVEEIELWRGASVGSSQHET